MIDGPVQGGTLPRPPSRSKATKVSSVAFSLPPPSLSPSLSLDCVFMNIILLIQDKFVAANYLLLKNTYLQLCLSRLLPLMMMMVPTPIPSSS